ncbi:3-methyl-2-oxobutanoate hydroxymethyltransferase PanB [Gottschalkia acidurici 9a]|uniref:3-methyl-2-oxobutanoate hydroxymethyltransferase n=1 Tax=Gottschalkia acidurici (strain ATCC 7906 / DSM 604 / BCRC 14475 / CIP 104303 / KCTC 5404 / NCIMB 10678 / 9a) TaxID=1128398 RepID=K0B4S7_GOTA9|nr:3-methyl-2-oxobutanoate hydroxymethyltransferase [Gottschalkia acidurici]AFS79581.1 3-methyl-2-oxobutanoate hydroxymethyltransferase PanB [Gottschalkia acidurici 9a]
MKEKFTVNSFLESKRNNEKITVLTAYDYQMARLIDDAGIDCILVGDSLGMVVLGYENTLEVTLDDMIHHAKAVSRGVNRTFVVADMPFLSYHISVEESVRNAGRLIQEGKAHAVKLEGGIEVIDKIKAIINAKIPVLGHIGLTPQSVNMFGGFKVQGKDEERAKSIIKDALELEKAGVFGIVLEGIPEKLAKIITEKLTIPTIGIGAGNSCDGQVLVINDMLGMYDDFVPKFVKTYANLKDEIENGVKQYIREVKEIEFPGKEHTFNIDDDVLEKLY